MNTSRLGVFGRPPFAAYWAGGLLSNAGTWLQAVAASVYIYDRSGSAFAVGILNFATFVPVLLFSVTGGVLSDRLDRRVIVVVTHAASVILSLALAALIATGAASELHVIALAFAIQTSATIAKPSLTAMLPALVPRAQLGEAVGLNTLQFLIGQIAGPLIAALVLATSGPAWAFALNALTYLGPVVAMAYLARLGLGGPSAAAQGPDATGVPPSTGLVLYVRSQPWIVWALAAVICTSAILEIVRTTAPVLVTERLGAPSSDTGLNVAAQSVGSVFGILAFVPLRRRDLSRQIAGLGLILEAVGLVVLSQSTSLPAAALSVVAIGMGFSLCFPVVTGVLQTEVPDAIRGRLMSVHQMAHLGNRPFAALLAGAVAASLGVPAACLAATLLIPLGLISIRSVWRLLDAGQGEAALAAPQGP